MEPMPTLEGAVYPPRVDPPAWSQRHPRAAGVLGTLPWVVLTLFMVDRLRTDGFSWHVVVGLVIFAFILGHRVAELDRPSAPVAADEG